jgi:hypothetical protein
MAVTLSVDWVVPEALELDESLLSPQAAPARARAPTSAAIVAFDLMDIVLSSFRFFSEISGPGPGCPLSISSERRAEPYERTRQK